MYPYISLFRSPKDLKRGLRKFGDFYKVKRGVCEWDSIILLESSRIQNCNTVIYNFNIQTTIWMFHSITKRLEIHIDINIEISEVYHYTWIFTSIIFRLSLETTFSLNTCFFLTMAWKLLWQSTKLNKLGRS